MLQAAARSVRQACLVNCCYLAPASRPETLKPPEQRNRILSYTDIRSVCAIVCSRASVSSAGSSSSQLLSVSCSSNSWRSRQHGSRNVPVVAPDWHGDLPSRLATFWLAVIWAYFRCYGWTVASAGHAAGTGSRAAIVYCSASAEIHPDTFPANYVLGSKSATRPKNGLLTKAVLRVHWA